MKYILAIHMIVSIQLLLTLALIQMFFAIIILKNINKNNFKYYSHNSCVSLTSATGHRMKIYSTASVNMNFAKSMNVTAQQTVGVANQAIFQQDVINCH